MAAKKNRGLGRGLDSLLGEDVFNLDRSMAQAAAGTDSVQEIRIEDLVPNPYQPRTHFENEKLQELAASIRKQGVISPIVVRAGKKGKYEIIAGERRYRASQLAGKKTVPAIVRTMDDKDALAAALIENMQREDLNAIEEALGLRRLMQEFSFTQEQAADAVGRSRPAAANLLRLLNLAPQVQQMLADGKIDMGHARCLVPLAGALQIQLAEQIAEQGLSVREAEALVDRVKQQKAAQKSPRSVRRDADTLRVEERIAETFGCPVKIRSKGNGAGTITLSFDSLDSFDSLLEKLNIESN